VKVVQFFSKETSATNSLQSLYEPYILKNTCTVHNIALKYRRKYHFTGLVFTEHFLRVVCGSKSWWIFKRTKNWRLCRPYIVQRIKLASCILAACL